MIDDEYTKFIERFKNQLLTDVSREQYNIVKTYISSNVDMLEYAQKINRNYHDKLIRYGMYYSLVKYYPYELKGSEAQIDIRKAIKEKNDSLEIKNKKVVTTQKEEINKIKPIKDVPTIKSNNSHDIIIKMLEMYQDYGILSLNINIQEVAFQIENYLKQYDFTEEDIVNGKTNYIIKSMVYDLKFGNEFTQDFENFRQETLNYLLDNRKIGYIGNSLRLRCVYIATELAAIFKINGIERKDFAEDAVDKYIENYLMRDLIKENSVEKTDYKEAFNDRIESVKNTHSKIKAMPKEKKIDTAVISIRIFLALVMLKMVQTFVNYVYDNTLEKMQERQRRNVSSRPKYEYSIKNTSSDGYYAIDELLHGQYNPETNEYMIGSDEIAKL